MFFAIFGFFLKIYQNMGQKLGSNRAHININGCELRLDLLPLELYDFDVIL